MKNFKSYLTESTKKYDYKIKIAGELTNEQEDLLKRSLEKYQLHDFKKVGKTPIQDFPLDFPKIKNVEVNIFEVCLNYPATTWDLHEYLANQIAVTKDTMVVRRPNEPYEEYQAAMEELKKSKKDKALLDDPEYKESTNHKFDDYFGDKYNSNFVKELNDILKSQRRERGEKIPSDTAAKFNSGSESNTKSVLGSRKK